MRSSLLSLSLSLSLVACGDEEKPQETGEVQSCEVEVASVFPVDGAADAYYRDLVEAWLTEADPLTTPTLTLLAGDTPVAGTSRLDPQDPTHLLFTPDAPLDPQVTYTANLDYCRGLASWSFTTSELGGALTSDLTGRTWVMGADFRVVEPENAAPITTLFGELPPIFLAVKRQGADTLEMVSGMGVEGSSPPVQDSCSETFQFPGSVRFQQAPYFTLAEGDLEVEWEGATFPFGDAVFTGTFSPDGSWIGGGTLGATLDLRSFEDFLGIPAADACAITEEVGAPCQPCDDGTTACLTLLVDQMSWTELPGFSFVEIPVVTDPDCPQE